MPVCELGKAPLNRPTASGSSTLGTPDIGSLGPRYPVLPPLHRCRAVEQPVTVSLAKVPKSVPIGHENGPGEVSGGHFHW